MLKFTWGFSDEEHDEPEQTRFEPSPEGDGYRLTFMTTYDQVGESAVDAAGLARMLRPVRGEPGGRTGDRQRTGALGSH